MIEATCPKCHTINQVGDELMGRYTFCQDCRCRFYVEAPTLEQSSRPKASPAIREPRAVQTTTNATTLDELLWDTQQGSRYLIRALDEQRQMLQRTNALLWAIGALAVANLVCMILNLAR